MTSNVGIPAPVPKLPDDQKFNGGIRITWKPIERKIKVSLKNQGLNSYINGLIKKPSTDTTSGSQTAKELMPVFSNKPSKPEWAFCNNRTKGIIESYIADLPSMVPEVDEMDAKELFNMLIRDFGQKDDMRKVSSMRKLRSHIFRENKTLDTFLCTMREFQKEAIDMGNEIPNKVFREIVLAAFPTSTFDTIMQNINANPSTFPSSTSIIQHISFQYLRAEN
ncbi:hypothetical protein F5050DRAFT_1865300 [Lentinula boryana]|uniref:Retrotransposon gag domain-containing protein n=1 Tax=Lentinula boryana TaxID=40481 RepID=A0ABQ8PZG2_9AGAR|nr:hypothetical protein F5050DRAFT_1865300 [Lentinula boryana]